MQKNKKRIKLSAKHWESKVKNKDNTIGLRPIFQSFNIHIADSSILKIQ